MSSEETSPSDPVMIQIVSNLVEYRVRVYENIASDAMTLLNIQMLTLPITLSLLTLINSSGDSQGITVEGMNIKFIAWGAIVLTISLGCTVFIHYFARKKATRTPNQLREYLISKYDTIEEPYPKNSVYENYRDLFVSSDWPPEVPRSLKINDDDDTLDLVLSELDRQNSPEKVYRLAFSFCVLVSLIGITLIVIGIAQAVYKQIAVISILIATFVLLAPTAVLLFAIFGEWIELIISTFFKILQDALIISYISVNRIKRIFIPKFIIFIRNSPVLLLSLVIYVTAGVVSASHPQYAGRMILLPLFLVILASVKSIFDYLKA